jgi:hypothetical protein
MCAMNAPSTLETSKRAGWRVWIRAAIVLLILYALGYFLLMDRHRPTSPFRAANDYFDSSFRWAAMQRTSKGTGPETQFPEVTVWNILYRPLDRIYFRLFPRPDVEVERLRAIGYYR